MQTILITGANRGLGLALTRVFLEKSHCVIATVRDPQRATALTELKEEQGKEHLQILPLEVTDGSSAKAAAAELLSAGTRLDVLVNNAGVHPEDGTESFGQMSPDDFLEAWKVNFMGVVHVCHSFLPLLQQGSNPRLVNISSGAGSVGTRDNHQRYAYGASKAALNHLTRGLAHELKSVGVTVVALSPGWVRTDMGGPDAELAPEESARAMAKTILGLDLNWTGQFLDRHGRPDTYSW